MAESALLLLLALSLLLIPSASSFDPYPEYPYHLLIPEIRCNRSAPVEDCPYYIGPWAHSMARFRWMQQQIDWAWKIKEAIAAQEEAEAAELRKSRDCLVVRVIRGIKVDVAVDFGKGIVRTAWQQWVHPLVGKTTQRDALTPENVKRDDLGKRQVARKWSVRRTTPGGEEKI